MTDHKPAPRCPYCGTPMVWEEKIEGTCWYECYKCGATAPTEETVQAAYEAAMQRWQEPNRVLTLSDLALLVQDALAGVPVWLQHKNDTDDYLRWQYSGWHILTDVHNTRYKEIQLDDDNSKWLEDMNMGIMWRVWLRQPTQKEMEDTPWEK